MTNRKLQRWDAVLVCGLATVCAVCGLWLANAAGCDSRAATAVALGCGALGLAIGAAVAR